jgi:putative membrane protein
VIAGDVPDSGWQWLSPRSLVVRPVTDLIRLIPVLAGALFFGTAHGGGAYWTAGLAILAIGASVIRWCTTRYRITTERIYLRHGLLSQKVLSVPRDRVRSVDFSAHLIYRALGLRRVSVGTGRSDRHEHGSLHLDALTLADAEALRAMLLVSQTAPGAAAALAVPGAGGAYGVPASPAAVPAERELARLRLAWVRFAPLTLTGLVIIGVVLGSATQILNDLRVNLVNVAPVYHLGIRFGELPAAQRIIDAVLAVLVLVVLLSVVGYIAVFWNFRLVRYADVLRVSRGLLTTRTTTIDTRRLRGAELSEPLLLRLAGGARCLAITTGLRVGEGAEHGGSLLLPPAPRRAAQQVTAAVLATAPTPNLASPPATLSPPSPPTPPATPSASHPPAPMAAPLAPAPTPPAPVATSSSPNPPTPLATPLAPALTAPAPSAAPSTPAAATPPIPATAPPVPLGPSPAPARMAPTPAATPSVSVATWSTPMATPPGSAATPDAQPSTPAPTPPATTVAPTSPATTPADGADGSGDADVAGALGVSRGITELVTGELVRHGPAARRRRYVRALGSAFVLIAVAGVAWGTGYLPAWGWLATLVLLPLGAALAADRYRSLGHRLTGGWLITRTGTLVRRRCVLSTDGIIGWRIHQSFFQRRQGLVSLAATTAAGHQHYVAHDIPAADAVALAAAANGALITPFLANP